MKAANNKYQPANGFLITKRNCVGRIFKTNKQLAENDGPEVQDQAEDNEFTGLFILFINNFFNSNLNFSKTQMMKCWRVKIGLCTDVKPMMI